jgi:hypothetical protein
MVERNIARGLLSTDELEKSLKTLPDDGDNATYTSIDDLAADGSTK